MRKIVEDGNTAFETVPCIVEAEGGSEALRELRLIYANSDTRRMSSADISKQAERVEALLYQLKEEGVEFPGRMRDHVAEACKVSKSKLSRLKVIRDKLAPDIYAGYYERGKLPEDTAYELAKLPADTQRVIVDRATQKDRDDIRYLYSSRVKDQGADIQRFGKMVCRCEQGGPCVNVPNMVDKLYSNGWRGYTHCGSGCCYDCDELATCSKCCSRMAGVKVQKKAEKKEAKAAKAAVQAERDRPMIDALRLLWNRMGEACQAGGRQLQRGLRQGRHIRHPASQGRDPAAHRQRQADGRHPASVRLRRRPRRYIEPRQAGRSSQLLAGLSLRPRCARIGHRHGGAEVDRRQANGARRISNQVPPSG